MSTWITRNAFNALNSAVYKATFLLEAWLADWETYAEADGELFIEGISKRFCNVALIIFSIAFVVLE